MRLLHSLVLLFLLQSTIYTQTSTDSLLIAIEKHIDSGGVVDSLVRLFFAYLQACEGDSGLCPDLDYVSYLQSSYTWHITSRADLLRSKSAFERDYPASPFIPAMQRLIDHKTRVEDVIEVARILDSLPPETLAVTCDRYEDIGIIAQRCYHLQLPFVVNVKDTLTSSDEVIYQLQYEGNRGVAPTMSLVKALESVEIDIVTNSSSEGSIAVGKSDYQDVLFSIPGYNGRTYRLVFNQALDDNTDQIFAPSLSLGHGIRLKGVDHLVAPIKVIVSSSSGVETRLEYESAKDLMNEDWSERLTPGDFQLSIYNAQEATEEHTVSVKIPSRGKGFPWGFVVLVGLLIGLFYFGYTALKKAKATSRQIDTRPSATIQDQAVQMVLPRESHRQEQLEPMPPATPTVQEVSHANSLGPLVFDEVSARTSGDNYVSLGLAQLWADTTISSVYLSTSVIDSINQDVMLEENMKQEIGGFLLGRYTESGGVYDVFVDDYLDIEGEGQSEFQIGFGASAWSVLEDVLADRPLMELVGWFHTHPGHGVFLSRPDKNISHNFFNKPYQFAMEIDPLKRIENPSLDTAFFTQQRSGQLNNSIDLVDRWFSWTTIVGWAKG